MTAPAPTPPASAVSSGDAPSTRDRLLASAVELLAEKGSFEQVSLRAIAAGAGVTPTAVYRHFADHAAVLEAVAEWSWAQFERAVFDAGDPSASAVDRFFAQGLAYIAFADEFPGIYRVLMDRRFDDVARVSAGEAVFGKLVSIVADVLAVKGDPRDPLVVATQVHAWIHGIATINLAECEGQPDATSLVVDVGVILGLAPDL